MRSFADSKNEHRFLNIIYYLGKGAIEEIVDDNKRIITFSPVLRERLGHHIHGERWALTIKQTLKEKGLLERPLHIISANMHSVMNTLFARKTLPNDIKNKNLMGLYELLKRTGKQSQTRKSVKSCSKKWNDLY